MEASGNSDIRGAIYVDGVGRLSVGNRKHNLTYDQNVAQTRTSTAPPASSRTPGAS